MNDPPVFTTDPETLLALSTEALASGTFVILELPSGWKRPRDFPLPQQFKKTSRIRLYRPEAVLEWLELQEESKVKSEQIKARRKKGIEDVTDAT